MFKHLKIAPRLVLIGVAYLIPLGYAVYLYYTNVNGQIGFAEQEKLGVTYLRPTVKILHDVQKHYTLQARMHAGDREAAAAIGAVTESISKEFENYKAVNANIGADLQFDDAALKKRQKENLAYAAIAQKWQAMAQIDARAITAEQYDGLIGDLGGVIAYATQYSNLLLDPDLDSYSVMDAVTVPLPSTFNRVGSSERTVYALFNDQRPMNSVDAEIIGSLATMLEQDDIARANGTDMQTAYSEDANNYGVSATLKSNTEPKLNEYVQVASDYGVTLHGIVHGQAILPAQIFAQTDKVKEAAYSLWVAAANELDVLLDKRIEYFVHDRTMKLIMFLGLLTVATVASWLVNRSIRLPLKQLQTAMIEIADGKLDYAVPCLDLRDEIGDMARTLELFKETSMEASRMEKEQRKEEELKQARQKQVDDLIQQFDKKVSTLLFEVSHAADGMQGALNTMDITSRKTSDKSAATMTVTKETSSNVSAVAAAAEELSAAINEISRQVSRSASITQDAVHKTQDADVTVKQLAESAQRIGEVVTLISGIAEQIDLLALNATIESARAGDAGKGFAVVATEVKNLASQTSKATDTIASQISEVQKVVANVVTSLDKIRGTIDEVNGISSTIAAAVEEQGAATKEIAMNIQRTSDRVQEVAGNVTEVGDMAAETNKGAKNVIDSVNVFTGQSKTLQQEIEGFLGSIAKA